MMFFQSHSDPHFSRFLGYANVARKMAGSFSLNIIDRPKNSHRRLCLKPRFPLLLPGERLPTAVGVFIQVICS